MARFLPVAIAASLTSVSGVTQAADQQANPWHDFREPKPALNFDIPNEPDGASASAPGSRIIAGTEVIPNATVGFGMFGQKAEKSVHAPAVARELAMPRSRKAAVGFSFKF